MQSIYMTGLFEKQLEGWVERKRQRSRGQRSRCVPGEHKAFVLSGKLSEQAEQSGDVIHFMFSMDHSCQGWAGRSASRLFTVEAG